MNIVYINKSMAQWGGVERVYCDKMNYLSKKHGYNITLITYEQGNHPIPYHLDDKIKVIDLDVRFFPLFKNNAIQRQILFLQKLRLLKSKLNKALKEINPDYVVLTTYELDKFPCILSLPYRFIVESHIWMEEILQSKKHNNILAKVISNFIDRRRISYMNNAQYLVTLTNADKENWKKYIDIPIAVIPNMVTKGFNTISTYSTESKRIICVGRLVPQKGFDYLMEAWNLIAKKYDSWEIEIFGDGDLKTTLNNKITEYNLSDSMKIHNPTDKIFDEYNNSSIYVLSSRFEGFPLVLLEAMSCGLPCVAFDCPHGPSDIITHGEDGLIVPLGDIRKLAEAIEWMITHREERLRMSNNARLKAQRYTAEAIMPQWVEFFEKIANYV